MGATDERADAALIASALRLPAGPGTAGLSRASLLPSVAFNAILYGRRIPGLPFGFGESSMLADLQRFLLTYNVPSLGRCWARPLSLIGAFRGPLFEERAQHPRPSVETLCGHGTL